jgi:cobalt-zinc-cadmium efflux system membrane fusion protein
MYDSEQLHRIRTRFAPSTVLSLAKLDPQNRSLVVGDQVKKDQLLAQLYCASIGAKKDELYEALLAQKRTDALLGRVAAAIRNGQGPEATVADALKQVESSKKTIDVCLQDLRTMGVAESEIEAIRREANKAPAEEKANNSDKQKARRDKWSNVELRAPVDGIVVEINVNALEHIADSKQNLFQIAGLERLKVVLHASKEEVPSLPLLKGVERRWTIQPYQSEDALTRKDHLRQRLLREADRERLQALTQDQLDKRDSAKIDLDRLWQRIDLALDAPVEGVVIEDLTYEIDPAQHTAILKGYIDNKKQLLHAGQFVTATVNLAPPAPEVVLPASALVETGGQVFVFVQLDAKKMAYEQRRVAVVRRGKDEVHISGRLTAEERQKGFQTVRLGEQVVTSGVLELKAMLDELKANQDR